MTSCHSVAMHFSLVVTWCVVAMASESLEDIFTRCGVDSTLCNNLMMEGWNANSFRMAAVDLQGFEDVLTEWHSNHGLTTFQKACLRAAFESLRPPPTSSSNLDTAPSTGLSNASGSWTETFPPKLERSVLLSMKQKFMVNYPSELGHADLFPSTRLVSLIHDQITKKAWKWVPWKFRLSQTKSEEITGGRAQKMPKIDNMSLHNLLLDDPPSLEVNNNSMGVNSIRNMLEVHDRAIALCQGAHLANLKAYTKIHLYTDSSGARGILQRKGVGRLRHLSCRILFL